MELLKKYLNERSIDFEENVSMSRRTWIHRGGIAGIFVEPDNTLILSKLCSYLYVRKLDFDLIGHTSNLYFHNTYNPRIVVSTRKCNRFEDTFDYVVCECGVSVMKLSCYFINNGYCGMEYLTALPGTVGGALCNNSSCKENSISNLLISADVLLSDGKAVVWNYDDFKFSYRESCLKIGFNSGVILSVRLKKRLGNKIELRKIAEKNNNDRRIRLEGPAQNLGCTFNRAFVNGKMSIVYKLPLLLLSALLRLFFQNDVDKRKHLEKCFLLYITGYKDLIPYVSDRLFITYVWKDEKADERFSRYVDFMNKIMKTDKLEIQEKKISRKINLLTIHWGFSYGAVLQTYATYKLLEEMGYNVTLINLIHPKSISNRKNYRFGAIRAYMFDKFLDKNICLKTSKMYKIDPNLIPKADYTIVGSDQVWNRDITTNLALSYFLDFADNKRIAFSSSFGKEKWKEDMDFTMSVKKELSKFDAVSVRELSGVSICKDTFGLSAVNVLDPTLVYGRFEDLVGHTKPNNKVFVFLMKTSEETNRIVNYVSNVLNLKVCNPGKLMLRVAGGPINWLRRMYKSSFVITSSFHGLAFAIIFRKNFIVLCADSKKFTRLQSLLDMLDLSDRYVKSFDDLKNRANILTTNINYEKVDRLLTIARDKSKLFLKHCLK